MRERAALLNLVAEMRGRLDELERMIRTAPNQAILAPASYDEAGVVDLTPAEYASFRATGFEGTRPLHRYEPFLGFTQIGASEGSGETDLTAFPLADLHRTGPEPAFGLRFQPRHEEKLPWYTYEILTRIEEVTQYEWLEWVVKLSFAKPMQSFVQFIVEGQGFSEAIDVGNTPVSDFASFRHLRLDRSRLMEAAAGRPIRAIRLTFSTGGLPVDMELYGLALFGRAKAS